jgi:hypothetical protein
MNDGRVIDDSSNWSFVVSSVKAQSGKRAISCLSALVIWSLKRSVLTTGEQVNMRKGMKMVVVKAKPDFDQAYLFASLVMRGLPEADFRLIWPKERKVELPDDCSPVFKRRLQIEHVALLHQNNAAGYGVYMTPQQTDGLGVKNENVVRILSVVADLDLKKTRAAKPKFPLPPSFEVESSPGNFNTYWLVDPAGPVSFEQHTEIMARLAHSYGSDPATKDRSHIFRVAGFFHTKEKPVMSRLHVPKVVMQYTAAELTAAFPKLKTSEKAVGQPQPATHKAVPLGRIEELLSFIPVDEGRRGQRYGAKQGRLT